MWGYAAKQLTEEGLLELREVTFSGESPEYLREIARFLIEMAERIETGRMRHPHLHIGDLNPDWDTKHPGKDIIVSMPVDWDALMKEVEERRKSSSGSGTFKLECGSPTPEKRERG